ncbi:nucleotide-binding alpha-beta plait domain-containing protein [Tanacetum coccineum]
MEVVQSYYKPAARGVIPTMELFTSDDIHYNRASDLLAYLVVYSDELKSMERENPHPKNNHPNTPQNHGNTSTTFNHDELIGEPWKTVNRRAKKEMKYNKISTGITKGEGTQEGKQRSPLFNTGSKHEGNYEVNQDEGKEDEKGNPDPSHNVVNFFFTNFPPDWNKTDLHGLFAEVREIAELYMALKVSKAGRKFGFASFFLSW